MAKKIDLVGQRFGKLLVLERGKRVGKTGNSYWLCKCECGVEKEISAIALRHGQKSCGCSAFDFAKNKVIGNEYEIEENGTVHVTLRSGDEMLCDLEDWERLRQYTWTKDAWGYSVASVKRKRKKFHVMTLGKREGYVIDHIDQNKLNNKKNNLRFVTKAGNSANSKLSKNNTSGIKGVVKCKNKWHAQIMVGGKNIHLGNYDKKEEAAEARRKAEEKYFKPLFENN